MTAGWLIRESLCVLWVAASPINLLSATITHTPTVNKSCRIYSYHFDCFILLHENTIYKGSWKAVPELHRVLLKRTSATNLKSTSKIVFWQDIRAMEVYNRLTVEAYLSYV